MGDKSCSTTTACTAGGGMVTNDKGYNICTPLCSDYLYEDGACLANCPTPYVKNDTATPKTCNNPCAAGSLYYDDASPPAGSCVASITCLSPWVK